MLRLADIQPGYLGAESVRDGSLGITVLYWRDLEAIRAWKALAEDALAVRLGRDRWYAAYKTRICMVEHDHEFVSRFSVKVTEFG